MLVERRAAVAARDAVAGHGNRSTRLRRLSSTGVVGVITIVAAAVSTGTMPMQASAQAGDPAAGKAVYERKCLGCHGEKGDGRGPAAELLDPKPRDFTSGIYKIRTTAGRMPSDEDLFRVISDGMPGTSMPAWAVLPEKDRRDLVAYVKTFAADKFKEPQKRIELPKEVASSPESVKRGKEMFEAIECNKCHGTAGRADGPSRPELKDEWKHPIKPANLTKRWNFRGGPKASEIAIRLAGGVLGTPMPSFADSVEKPEDIWHLANYVASLGPESPDYASLVTATAASGPPPDDPDAEAWTKLPGQNIALVGQVIQDPRNFNPAIDMVTVRALYDDKEIAFHLTWDDPTASKPDGAQVFADRIALQFAPKVEGAGERPYFLMGDDANAVYQLRWESGGGPVEVTANGPSKVTPLAGSEASAKVVFDNGQYRVVLKRPLASKAEGGATFEPDVFLPVAFQAWDGGAGETGARMSLTSWYYLRLEAPQSNAHLVVPPVVALLTLGAMLLVVWAANRRRSSVP